MKEGRTQRKVGEAGETETEKKKERKGGRQAERKGKGLK